MAGAAPPVMLMICGFTCGVRTNRETGNETLIPGCRMKFELSSRKKISRNTTSRIATTPSQPK
jgi:hypothetical protein